MNRPFFMATAIVVTVLATPSPAAIIERDLYAPGDGLLTYDTVNQREWLDLNATPTVTHAQFDAASSSDERLSLFEGF